MQKGGCIQLAKLLCGVILTGMFAVPVHAESALIGLGYGREFRGNNDLQQYELTWRHPLPWEKTVAGSLPLSTAIELAIGLIEERGSDESPTFRLALMPMAILSTQSNLRLLAGLGTGFMVGETEFTRHNLGGSFFFNGKLGVQILLGEGLGLEYVFYHQSNAGIYDYNASLNMHHLALSWSF